MNAKELKQKYLDFFKTKNHAVIPSAPLIPDNDPTVLFTTAGMHPLIPFLMGQPHPLGKRICNVQKCVRTQDIDEVGDATHTTFFEMLGNWSLGDYFKKEAIAWSYEFLTDKKWLGLDKNRLAFTCFAGDADAPKDEEAAQLWRGLGVSSDRIRFLTKNDNWWGPAGETGPCGPDTEMFYWMPNDIPAPKVYDPADKNWVEIWNDVFMQYNKQKDGKFVPLQQKNVDTGLGVERVNMILQGKQNVFETELFQPIFKEIEKLSGESSYSHIQSFRIVADHIRAATFILGDERDVVPSNVDQGYVLRRFIRRVIRHGKLIGIQGNFCVPLAKLVISMYKDSYPALARKEQFIINEMKKEEARFLETLEKGLREFEKTSLALTEHKQTTVSGRVAFLLFQSYGFPLEMTVELAREKGMTVDIAAFNKEYEKHKELSRVGAEQKFKGGLSDSSERTVRLHTATHLLNEALRKVLDKNIVQKGSNITAERLRFDFNFDRKLTSQEVNAVETEVNRVIKQDFAVERLEMTPEQATRMGAQSEFGARYPAKVSVYKIDAYSLEICGGPHITHTGQIGTFKILKEEACAAGVRRIKATIV